MALDLPRRVLHLIPTFGEGGAERQLALLSTALPAKGIECHIAYNNGGKHFDMVRQGPSILHKLPPRSNVSPMRVVDLVSVCQKVKPDIVHTWLTQMDVAGGLAAQIFGCRHALSERSSAAAYPNSWKNWLRARVGKRADMIVANSETGALYWRNKGVDCPIFTIANALKNQYGLDYYHYVIPELEARLPQTRVIVFAGRFSSEKNIAAMIAGIDIALTHLPEHHTILFGNGPQRSDVERWVAKANNADRFHLPGFTNNMGFWRKKADVFVSVSHFEGQPNVVLEAAHERCPLVLSDIAEHRECLSGGSATWVNKDDAESIGAGIGLVILNAAVRAAQVESAYNDVRHLTLERMTEKYCMAYSEAIKMSK